MPCRVFALKPRQVPPPLPRTQICCPPTPRKIPENAHEINTFAKRKIDLNLCCKMHLRQKNHFFVFYAIKCEPLQMVLLSQKMISCANRIK